MRYRVRPKEEAALRDIAAELEVIRPGSCAVDVVLPAMRQLLELETMMLIAPVVDGGCVTAERFSCDGYPDPATLQRLFLEGFAASPVQYAWYDPVSPEAWQRNRVIDARVLMTDEEFARSAIYKKCLQPANLHRQRQPRVLVCDGTSLLGWFGSFTSQRIEPRHRTLLRRLIAPMRRRLSLDRRLVAVQRRQHALETALDELGAAAMIIGNDGRIHEANAAARALADTQRRDLTASITDAIAGRPCAVDLELIPLQRIGASHGWLAIVRTPRDQHLRACLDAAASGWNLSARQREVLGDVARGQPNLTIAMRLGVTQRAVELQVSTLLARAGVESRAGLVAALFGTFG